MCSTNLKLKTERGVCTSARLARALAVHDVPKALGLCLSQASF